METRNYEKRTVPERVGVVDEEMAMRIFAHVMGWLFPLDWTMHDKCDDTIHLEWFAGGPTRERPFRTVVTAGMSSAPMLDRREGKSRLWWGELVMLLPPDWPLDIASLQEERYSWPLELMALCARLPHLCDSVFWSGDLFTIGTPPEPLYEGVPFTGVVVGESDLLPDGFFTMPVRPGKEVCFHCLFPIHKGELAFAKEHGVDAIFDRLTREGVSDVLDCSRPDVCA